MVSEKKSKKGFAGMKLKKRLKGLDDVRGYPKRFAPDLRRDPDLERLVCVAIERDGKLYVSGGFKAHWELRASMGDVDPYKSAPGDIEGFWTSRDRFVGRFCARDIAVLAGQADPAGRELLSSDVRW